MTHIKLKSIAVFCGSSTGHNTIYQTAAKQLAEVLVNNKITLIYGGGSVGLMGTIADHMLNNDGQVIGVIPQLLVDLEVVHTGLTELHTVNTMHERKALMTKLADAFILLPGGLGSLDEFFEVLTHVQLGYHYKPCGILNTKNYYKVIINFLDHGITEGFLKKEHKDMVLIETDPKSLVLKMQQHEMPKLKKWIKDY